jgi:excisionase family DNA binding protein
MSRRRSRHDRPHASGRHRQGRDVVTKLVDANKVSELTGFSTYTVREMARDGRIPARKVGRFTRFDLGEVQAWMARLPKASSRTA